MAIITPLMVAVNPQVPRLTNEADCEWAVSFEEENSQLFDAFLESCTATAQTHLAPLNAMSFNSSNLTILTLPLNIIKNILRNLLTSPTPLVLQHDVVNVQEEYHTHIDPNVLQVCKIFHNIGTPILYSENTLTTSSPATSFDFDKHVLSLPGSKRQMITNVKLEIDWADRLWAKFPLVARALGELKGLQKLDIAIVPKKEPMEQKRVALVEKEANQKMNSTYARLPRNKLSTAHQQVRLPATNSTNVRIKREGAMADVMLKAEMKMLHDLVTGIKGLKDFRLTGFRHEVFAWCLEEHVRIGYY